MPRMLNLGEYAELSSILSMAIRILSLYSPAISSRMGAIILQGPHHSAQKSSNTGLSDLSTSWLKVASLVCTMCELLTRFILHGRTKSSFKGKEVEALACEKQGGCGESRARNTR